MIIGTSKLYSTDEPMFVCSCRKCGNLFHISQRDKRIIQEFSGVKLIQKKIQCPNCKEETE